MGVAGDGVWHRGTQDRSQLGEERRKADALQRDVEAERARLHAAADDERQRIEDVRAQIAKVATPRDSSFSAAFLLLQECTPTYLVFCGLLALRARCAVCGIPPSALLVECPSLRPLPACLPLAPAACPPAPAQQTGENTRHLTRRPALLRPSSSPRVVRTHHTQEREALAHERAEDAQHERELEQRLSALDARARESVARLEAGLSAYARSSGRVRWDAYHPCTAQRGEAETEVGLAREGGVGVLGGLKGGVANATMKLGRLLS